VAAQRVFDLDFVNIDGVVIGRANEYEDDVGGIEFLYNLLFPLHPGIYFAVAPHLDAPGQFEWPQLSEQFTQVLRVFAGIDGEEFVRLWHG